MFPYAVSSPLCQPSPLVQVAVTMWSVMNLPKAGLARIASRSASLTGFGLAVTSNVNGALVLVWVIVVLRGRAVRCVATSASRASVTQHRLQRLLGDPTSASRGYDMGLGGGAGGIRGWCGSYAGRGVSAGRSYAVRLCQLRGRMPVVG